MLKGETLLTFKQFLETQDPNIDPEKASISYAEYKREFTIRQTQKFYSQHKDEDWFEMEF